jgi:hypothetical protein
MNPLPKKLDDALREQSRYKPSAEPQPESVLSALLHGRGVAAPPEDYSFEQGLLESILGASGRKPSSASGSRSSNGSGLFPSRVGNSGRVLADAMAHRPADPLLWPRRSPRKAEAKAEASSSRRVAATREQAAGSPPPSGHSSARTTPRSDHSRGGRCSGGGSGGGPGAEHTATASTATSSGSHNAPHASSEPAAAEQELVASMASRLSQLEKASRSLRKDLVAKDKQVRTCTHVHGGGGSRLSAMSFLLKESALARQPRGRHT